ncbi:MAG: cysteine synthase A [Clostridia bacterium]|nr:cysteine synthase A [Clostridia bacterium]
MEILSGAERLIGNTPMVRLQKTERDLNLRAELYAKLESANPTGSSKDRAALFMLAAAEQSGELSKGGTVIEPTSGNTGIALAALCAVKGYKAVIVMPETMSEERKNLMRVYGAKLVLTDGALGMAGSIEKAKELCAKTPNSIILGQFENPANAKAHYHTTGPEIHTQMGGRYEIFVAGVGTGGTFTGTVKYLKEQKSDVYAVAVEPKSSAVLSGEKSGPHGLQGIGAGFIPSVLDTSLIDEIVKIDDESAYFAVRYLLEKEGLFVGISSGAAFAAAVELAKREENAGKKIVTVFPDSGTKYLSVL